MTREFIDILITYGPMLMLGLVAPMFPHISFLYFVLVGVVWIFLWRLVLRKKSPYFNVTRSD